MRIATDEMKTHFEKNGVLLKMGLHFILVDWGSPTFLPPIDLRRKENRRETTAVLHEIAFRIFWGNI